MGVISYSPLAGGWLSGRYRKDSEQSGPMSIARQRLANRFDLSLPANQRKLDAAEQLAAVADQAGLTDRIDEIVPPGVTLNPADNGWASPSLQAAARRR